MDIFSNVDIWETLGPIILGGIAVAVVGLICFLILRRVENRSVRNLLSILAVVLIVLGAYGTIYYGSGIWGSR
ncbi:hypothetical protein D3C76_576740 [compost metagenome]